LLDELRVSNVARGSGWVNTSFNSMSDPDLFVSVGIEEIVPQTPVVFDPSPVDGELDVSVSLSSLSFTLVDYQGDEMSYSVESYPDIGTGGGTGGNGLYSVDVSGLDYSTVYVWYVNVSDPLGSGSWNNQMFVFSTVDNVAPVVSDPVPGDGVFGVSLNPVLSVNVSDFEGDVLDVFFWSNVSTGVWHDW